MLRRLMIPASISPEWLAAAASSASAAAAWAPVAAAAYKKTPFDIPHSEKLIR
jgi:hypothetical protein